MDDRVLELAGKGQPQMPLPLRGRRRKRALNRKGLGRPKARRIAGLVVSYKTGVGDVRE